MNQRHAATVRLSVERIGPASRCKDHDLLAAEEPLEIRLQENGNRSPVPSSVSITMRTPGQDFELAAGFLFAEGIIESREDIVDISHCADPEEPQVYNIVTATLRSGLTFDARRLERHFYTNSSCGVCGKAALEALEVRGCSTLPLGLEVSQEIVRRIPETLRSAQSVFEQTGGLHASGLFDRYGKLLALREDVGRHNALDKVLGDQLLKGHLPLDSCLLAVSGRGSFELVQKALMARIPVMIAVGAPSSLAVELARSFRMTLLGFVKTSGFNIYAGAERVVEATASVSASAEVP